MLVIFDLDGTLIDSAEDIAIATNQTRANFGMPPLDAKLIHSYVGNGAAMLVRRALGPQASERLVSDGLTYFVKFYRQHALEHTRLFPGVAPILDELSAQGHTLAVLTNKPVRISTDIVAGLGLGSQFKSIYGGDSFAHKKPDPVGINTLMEETASSPENTWMVGDSGVDVQTARNANVRACGVAWGFQPEAFEKHPPDILIQKPEELRRVLEQREI